MSVLGTAPLIQRTAYMASLTSSLPKTTYIPWQLARWARHAVHINPDSSSDVCDDD